ncbi:hypothetical protein [Aliarcobacter cryaerophilus]|uniref:hypothetical protein n=1 Tax=Aliarcobacter cryaerophilus TaxID=28198 RepID=UPI003DA36DEC
MGMNMILTLIAGIVMTTMIGSTIAPSIVEGVKVKKVQTQTINNQEVIFEAIKRYTTLKQVAPTSIQDLINEGYLEANVNNNGFGGTYTINVNKALGVATITTTISDPKAQEAFLNSFTGTSKPTRVGTTNNFETKFVLPNEVMHGNALLMTGIPIQATPPDSNINKYWYDTSSGKATLKLFDGTNWIEVNLGGSGDDSTNVKLTGDQTIEGIKTFISFPLTPSSNPINDYQVANKKYVDDNRGLGYNQTWQNVTSSRSFDVYYTNNTNKPIFVSCIGGTSTSGVFLKILVDEVLVSMNQHEATGYYDSLEVSTIVPPNSKYKIVDNGMSNITWSELR